MTKRKESQRIESKPAETAPSAGKRIGVLYRVEPHQSEALRREAFQRATKRGSGKPDSSEVLREIIDAWIETQRTRR